MMLNPLDTLNASILIVDDQEVNILLLERLLGQAGYVNVSSTRQPAEVVALHQAHRYDLILLDLQMPVMDGFEVMEGLKAAAADPYLPVVVLTAQPAHKLRALQAGAKDFISKPFDLTEVKTRIHNMLEVRLLYKRLESYNEVLEEAVRLRTAELRESELRFRRLTELASDWYWEQNDTGEFTQVSGPALEMVGIGMPAFLGEGGDGKGKGKGRGSRQGTEGWNEIERLRLQEKILARQSFIDFAVSRVNPDGSKQQFRVSGEPIFDESCRFTGYRGIGVEVRAEPS